MFLLRRPTKVPIKGAVVLITGAGSGIGQLMAIECAKRGARVLVLWDIKDPVDTAEEIMREVGAGVVVRRDVVDVTADLHDTAQAVMSEFGRVDILINNAGIVTGKSFLDLTDDDVERTFAVNTLSHYRTTREFLPGMLQRDRGSVVTIASAAGLVGVARQTDYSASKFGAVGFAESLRAELRHRGSNVHTLLYCPYYIDTGMFDGVKTKFAGVLPILKPSFVAKQIIDAVESGAQMKVAPKIVRLVQLIKPLPVPIVDAIGDFFGINATMDDFTGRI